MKPPRKKRAQYLTFGTLRIRKDEISSITYRSGNNEVTINMLNPACKPIGFHARGK